jgi:endonuclease/exonuclease/phosphatase (EEP) superfamily protein YafD
MRVMSMMQWMRQLAVRRRAVSTFLAATLALVTATSVVGWAHWLPALLPHFRPHLAAASIVCLALASLAGARGAAAMSLAALAANAAPLLPYLPPYGAVEAVAAGSGFRVLALHRHGEGADPAAFRALIQAERPDIVLLTELPAEGAALLDEFDALPPHRAVDRRSSAFDVALFSRWPIRDWTADRSVARALPVLAADICDSTAWSGCLRVVGLHAARPFGDGLVLQQRQLGIAATLVAAAPDGRALLMGDLNVTPWAPGLARLLRLSGLSDSGYRRGLTATWFSRLPFIGLPIDHVLMSAGIVAKDNRLGRGVGSDHWPVIADLAVAPGASP